MQDGQRFCGWDDEMLLREQARRRSGLSKWHKRHLKTFIASTAPGVDGDVQVALMVRAMDAIEAVCNITFEVTKNRSQADLYETTSRIDGRSGTLAWHELPNGNDGQLDGKIDSSERWDFDISDGVSGISLFAVWLHELCHGMGLPHAPRGSGALMEPFYSSRILSLQAWDIDQLVKRYGEPVAKPPVDPPIEPGGSSASVLIDARDGLAPGLYSVKITEADRR